MEIIDTTANETADVENVQPNKIRGFLGRNKHKIRSVAGSVASVLVVAYVAKKAGDHLFAELEDEDIEFANDDETTTPDES